MNNKKDGKNSLEIFTIFLFLILNLASLAFLSVIVYNILCYADLEKYNLTFIVILITSIATSAFFLIRIYIENQLGIKEKEMLKEYQDFVREEIRKQNELQNITNTKLEDGQKELKNLLNQLIENNQKNTSLQNINLRKPE